MISLALHLFAQSADRDKLTTLYEQFRQPMYHAAFAILKEPYLAEDAVHNAFLRAVQCIDRIGSPEDPHTKGYLLIMARNAAIDLYNQNKRVLPSEEIGDAIVDIQNVELETESRAVREEVAGMIASLEPAYCEILVLKFYYELEDTEIAETLGISISDARVRLHRARNRLKQKLQEQAAKSKSLFAAKGGDR